MTVRLPATAAERVKARCIVEAYGRSALARLLLLPDKSYFFTSGVSVIGYVVKGQGAIVLGDPNGPAKDVPNAMMAFQRFCVRNDWLPAYFQVLPDSLDCHRRAYLNVACISHEVIVDLTTFTLQGGGKKRLRNVLNRMARLGYQAQLHEPPLSDGFLHQLRQVSDAWLSKEKFDPAWSSRYLVYPGPASLMTTAPALTRASAGDALLRDYSRDLVQSVPHLWRRWRQQGKQEA